MKQRAVIIAGTAGIGKSMLAQLYKNVMDLDSSEFKNIFSIDQMKLNAEQRKSTGVGINDQYPENYEKVIEGFATMPNLLLLISNQSFTVSSMERLKSKGIEICLAYPSKDLKHVYMQRYIKRGNNSNFLKRMDESFEKHIEEMKRIKFIEKHIILSNENDTLESKILSEPELIKLIKC